MHKYNSDATLHSNRTIITSHYPPLPMLRHFITL